MPTSSPWDGTTWDVTAPDIDQLIGNHYKEMYDLRKGVGIRIDKEHITLAGSSAGGEHLQGSARSFYLATASIPALQPDGTALAATDNGMSWLDSTTSIFYLLNDFSDPTIGGGWVNIGSTLGSIAVNTDKFTVDAATGNTLVAGTLTNTGLITANDGVTLGTGADLVGAADSVINMNAFDVSADGTATLGTSLNIAGTIAVVGTIDDDTMATATDTTIATSESIKAYVDTLLVTSGANDSNREFSFNGVEIKIGKDNLGANSPETVIFANLSGLTAFSNNCFQVIACGGNSENPGSGMGTSDITATSFKAWYSNDNVSPVRFIAIGW